MKKVALLTMLLFLSFVTVGCAFTQASTSTTTTTSMSDSTTSASTTTTTTETTTTTTDSRYQILIEEFNHIEPYLPDAMISDYFLPVLANNEITSYITLDSVVLSSQVIPFTASAFDQYCTLSITLFYQDLWLTREYTVVMLRDETMYAEYLTDQYFEQIKAMVDEQMPTLVDSDFTLPEIDNPDVTVTFTTDTSRIYNHRFIFTFPMQRTEFTITAKIRYNGETRNYDYQITMKALSELPQVPVIYIYTENNENVTSKDYYLNGRFSMVVYDSQQMPITIVNNQTIQIRARGNSTLWMPKKSFKVKFLEKQSLLFDYQEHDWVLLANFSDQTLIRNYLAYKFAQSITDEFEPNAAFVDVYLNDEFLGNYTLTDQIEVTNDRVDVEEHSTNLDTGYLVEFDRRQWDFPDAIQDVEWFNLYGVPYVIKSPSYDDGELSQDQFYFIESYFKECFDTIASGQDYNGLIDEASFIDWFIVEELFKNVDSGYASVFMIKDAGGKLRMGPVWDFDLSTSNQGHLSADLRVPTGWYTSLSFKNPWYYELMKRESFRQNLKTRWNELYDNQIKDLIDSVYPMADSIAKSRYMNFQIWDVIGKNNEWYTSTEVYDAKTYEEQVYILFNYLLVRSVWMNDAINDF